MSKEIKGKEVKRKFALWIRQSVLDQVVQWYPSDNCTSQSEFIEKAVLFYIGYLASNHSQEYISKNIMSPLRAMVNESDNRIARMLFKLTVELAMTMNIVASTRNITKDQLRELRATCVNEVKRTNGTYSLKDAVEMQNG